MSLASQLKIHRIESGLSQNDVASKLNLSRQSISKWENGHSVPDIEHLLILSDLYQVSIDDLLRENEALSNQIELNDEEIKDKKKEIRFMRQKIEQKNDEGLMLLVLASISSFIFPLGLLTSGFCIWRNKKTNSFYKLVYLVCIVAIFFNLFAAYGHIANYLDWGEVQIEKIN